MEKIYTGKTKDVFKNKIYKFECSACGTNTEIDTTEFVRDFEKQMKKLGITVK